MVESQSTAVIFRHKEAKRRIGEQERSHIEKIALKGVAVVPLEILPNASSQGAGEGNTYSDLAHLPSFHFLPGIPIGQIQPEKENHEGQHLRLG